MNIGIVSLGCPKNLLDSEIMLGKLQGGHRIVHNLADADVVLINTCSFIEQAREESIQMILELVEMKKQGTISYIIVCGCLAQKYWRDLESQIPLIDAMVGTFSLDKIVEAVNGLVDKKVTQTFVDTKARALDNYRASRYFLTPTHTKYLKIAEGCNHTCSFCVIPQLRGPYHSRPLEEIVDEARLLIASGTKELILIAQDTSYYGVDLSKKLLLPELLRRLNALPGVGWIRVLYTYPNNITDELIAVFRDCEHVCKYIDMPIQHSNDTILKNMHRGITRKKMETIIQTVRRAIPDVVLRTSVIVGYPGEGYEEFNELLAFIKQVRFERLGAFMYSDEVDTPAYRQKGKVKRTVIKSRFQDVMLQQQKISRAVNESLIGREFDVLIDGNSETEEGYYSGRTYMDAPDIDCQILVEKQGDVVPGSFVRVRVAKGSEYDLEGNVIR